MMRMMRELVMKVGVLLWVRIAPWWVLGEGVVKRRRIVFDETSIDAHGAGSGRVWIWWEGPVLIRESSRVKTRGHPTIRRRRS